MQYYARMFSFFWVHSMNFEGRVVERIEEEISTWHQKENKKKLNEKISKTFAFFDESARNKKREKFIFLEEEKIQPFWHDCVMMKFIVSLHHEYFVCEIGAHNLIFVFSFVPRKLEQFLSFLFKKASRN